MNPIQKACDDLVAAIRQDERGKILALLSPVTNATALTVKPATERVAARTLKLAKGQKRDPRVLTRTVTALHHAIQSAPGSGIERLGKRLNIPTKDLKLPVKKLLAAKRIRTIGHKRATRYFPRG